MSPSLVYPWLPLLCYNKALEAVSCTERGKSQALTPRYPLPAHQQCWVSLKSPYSIQPEETVCIAQLSPLHSLLPLDTAGEDGVDSEGYEVPANQRSRDAALQAQGEADTDRAKEKEGKRS